MLKAGFARLDMTPPLGSPIAGYFHIREMQGILDPLQLNCLALTVGEEKLVIITADLMAIGIARCREIAAAVEARTGVPASAVIVQALHQHK